MDSADSQKNGPSGVAGQWIEACLRPALADEARRLTRAAQRLGAAGVFTSATELRAVWPDDPQGRRAALAWCQEAGSGQTPLHSFTAQDPREAWAEPRVAEIAPNLKLGSLAAGARASEDTIVIDPLTAFGSGDHPSTRLNLRLLADLLSRPLPHPELWLADVGAGSGVLALALALLSGRPVLALDPETASRRAMARNRALNPLAGPLVRFVQATHAALSGSFALVASNLPAGILVEAAEVLGAVLAPGGYLVLSGFRQDDAGRVKSAFSAWGLREATSALEGDWVGLVLAR